MSDEFAKPKYLTDRPLPDSLTTKPTKQALAFAKGGSKAAPVVGGTTTKLYAATAATTPQTAPTLLQVQIRRLSWGLTPALEKEVVAAGGISKWANNQLYGTIDDSYANSMDSWFPAMNWTPEYMQAQLYGVNGNPSTLTQFQKNVMWNHLSNTRPARFLLRAAYSKKQLNERLVEFFANHLNVPQTTGPSPFQLITYDKLIRSKINGKFSDMLLAVESSSAMMAHLNGSDSTKRKLNENLGRELLELHTVGVGNYAENEITLSAKVLTGWYVDGIDRTLQYDTGRHYVGAISMPKLGFSNANSASYGVPAFNAYISYLAHHQATATRLATEMIRYFCNDNPTAAHVKAVSTAYLNSDTDIRTTVMAMINHADFNVMGKKMSRPLDDFLQLWRLRGLTPIKPTWNFGDGASVRSDPKSMGPYNMVWWASWFGQGPWRWAAPDGYPNTSDIWLNPGNFMNQWGKRESIANGQMDGFTSPDLATLAGIPKTGKLSAADMAKYFAQYVWGRPVDASLTTAMNTLFNYPLDPTNTSWNALYFGMTFAFNHPLMSIR